MSTARVAVQVRVRLPVLRAIDELVALTGASRESVIHDCLLAGLPAVRHLAGYQQDPATVAGDLLEVIGGQWLDSMSDDEAAAVRAARQVMARITQVRAREEKP